MRIADACMALDEPALGGAAYHLQQAAEKGIKGLLTVTGIGFRRTHDLAELGALASSAWSEVAPVLERLAVITVWNTAYRYPTVDELIEDVPDTQDLLRARADILLVLSTLGSVSD